MLILSRPDWSFTDNVDPQRQEFLLSVDSFDEVTEAILSNFTVVACEYEEFRGERLRGCKRYTFLIQVGREAYDLFFNSVKGYRAQFYYSCSDGKAANRNLIQACKQDLLEFAGSKGHSLDDVSLCLDMDTTKIWRHEQERVIRTRGSVDSDIGISKWIYNAEQALSRHDFEHISLLGVRAPLGELIEIKTAWVDNDGNEKPDKTHEERARDIQENGYT